MRKYRTKSGPNIFTGKFGEIRAKILRTLKNLPALTPMPDYICSIFSVQEVTISLAVTHFLNCKPRLIIFFHDFVQLTL